LSDNLDFYKFKFTLFPCWWQQVMVNPAWRKSKSRAIGKK